MAGETAEGHGGHLVRGIGLWGLSAVVLNGLVGAGVFALPAALAEHAGAWAPALLLTLSLALLPVVLALAKIARLYDRTGGPVAYVEDAFGPTAAFQVGWLQSLSSTSSAAAVANILADYLLGQTGWAGDATAHQLAVAGGLALVLIANLQPVTRTAGLLRGMSVAKLLPLLLLALSAIPVVWRGGLAAHPAADWSPGEAAVLAAFALVGFEGALTVAGEARNPGRDMPRAVIGTFLVVTLTYALLTAAYVAIAFDPARSDATPLISLASVTLGAAGIWLIVAAATVSTLANVINTLMLTSRRLLAMEALGGLPRWFGDVVPATGLPRNAVLISWAVIAALALSGSFKFLATLTVLTRLLAYLACLAGSARLHRARGLAFGLRDRVIVALAALVSVTLALQADAGAWLAVALAMVAGFAMLAILSRLRRAAATL
jgi:amino acid transporter